MSSFAPALEKTLAHEGGYFYNPKTGEVANYGITVWFLRSIGRLRGIGSHATDDEAHYVAEMTREDAAAIYQQYFWNPFNLEKIDDQTLAERVFDVTVNMGPGGVRHGELIKGGVTLLQLAANTLSPQNPITVDGHLGPLSLSKINGLDAGKLLATYKELAADYYRDIASRKPILADQLKGWLHRLDA